MNGEAGFVSKNSIRFFNFCEKLNTKKSSEMPFPQQLIRHFAIAFVCLSALATVPCNAQEFEGYVVEVTTEQAEIKDSSKVLAVVPRGTRLFVFRLKGKDWALVKDPNSDHRGWLHTRQIKQHIYYGEDENRLDEIIRLARRQIRLRESGNWAEAVNVGWQRLRICQQLLGEHEVVTMDAHGSLASALRKNGNPDAARPHYEHGLATAQRLLGSHHLSTATALNNIGVFERKDGNLAAARQYYEQAISIETKLLGANHPELVATRYNLALTYGDLGEYPSAVEQLRLALRSREKKSRYTYPSAKLIASELEYAIGEQRSSITFSPTLSKSQLANVPVAGLIRGDAQRYAAKLPKPIPRFYLQKLVDALPSRLRRLGGARAHGPANDAVAATHRTIKPNQRVKTVEKAIALTYLRGDAEVVIGGSITTLASDYTELGRYADAGEAIMVAYQLISRNVNSDDAAIGTLLRVQASLSAYQGDFRHSVDCWRAAIKINNQAAAEWNQLNNSPNALSDIRRQIAKKGREKTPTVHRAMLEFLEKGNRSPVNPYWPIVVVGYAEMSGLQALLGQYSDAIESLRQGESLGKQLFGPNDKNMAKIYFTQSYLSGTIGGDLRKAREKALQALSIQEATFGEDAPAVSTSLFHLAGVCRNLGEFDEAIRYQKRACELTVKLLGAAHPRIAGLRATLGGIYLHAGSFAKAEPLLRESARLMEQQNGRLHPDLMEVYALLGETYSSLGKTEDCVRCFRECIERLCLYADRTLPGFSEREQLAFLSNSPQLYRKRALQTLYPLRNDPGVAAAMVEFVSNTRGIALETLAARHQLASLGDDEELAELATSLSDVRSELAALVADGKSPRLQQDLLARSEQLSRELGRKTSRHQETRPYITIKELCAELPDEAALVYLLKARWVNRIDLDDWHLDRYVAWVVTGTGEVEFVELGDHAKIDEAVQACRHHLSGASINELGVEQSQKKTLVSLRQLSDLMIRPLEKILAGKQHWLISADDQLWSIPVSCLLLDNDHYVVENHEVSYINNGRELLRTPVESPQTASSGPPLIVVDPDFDFDLKTGDTGTKTKKTNPLEAEGLAISIRGGISRNWGRLPGTKLELEAARPHLSKFLNVSSNNLDELVLTDDQARESRVRNHRRPSLLLLSTHGYFLKTKRPSGFGIKFQTTEQGIEVQTVIAGGAAEIDGRLQVGDVIVAVAEIDQKEFASVAGIPRYEVGSFLSGEQDSLVRIRVVKSDSSEIVEYEFKRQPVPGATLAPTKVKALDNPLLRCGLVLAGANQRAEDTSLSDDGILTGMEIVGLDLRGTELVVLSACETGLGDSFSMEGVVGLRHAFQRAGAQAVVSTLWQISDEQTAQLMETFWKQLADGSTKTAALCAAQRAMIHNSAESDQPTSHPFFWAAFTTTGRE